MCAPVEMNTDGVAFASGVRLRPHAMHQPTTVYLDLNHWIGLAQARVGHPEGEQNGSYRWKRNDIYDLGHLGIAVPNCDVVATDGHAHAQMVACKLGERFQTAIVRRPVEIAVAVGAQ
jgi:hypothetical protein